MMSDLTTAREYGRAGKTPLFWMANEPFASEYKRGEAERVPATCKPPLPVQNETLVCDCCNWPKTGPYAIGDSCPNCVRGFLHPEPTPSRAVTSLSGEFPGLGKWELVGPEGPELTAFTLAHGEHGEHVVMVVDDDEIELWNIGDSVYRVIPNWHTLLSALPPREVVGDYVVGPHGVKFQVERITLVMRKIIVDALAIKADGYPLIALNKERIWLYHDGPLYVAAKVGDTTSWPLRGEA